jgi:hypothetical protein
MIPISSFPQSLPTTGTCISFCPPARRQLFKGAAGVLCGVDSWRGRDSFIGFSGIPGTQTPSHGGGFWMQVPWPLQPAEKGTFGSSRGPGIGSRNDPIALYSIHQIRHGALQGCASPSTPAQTRSLQYNPHMPCTAKLIN